VGLEYLTEEPYSTVWFKKKGNEKMAATRSDILSALQGSRRRSACFGAPNTNPLPPTPTKKGSEAAIELLDNFDWGSGDKEAPPAK
jgi:hypothetical protein